MNIWNIIITDGKYNEELFTIVYNYNEKRAKKYDNSYGTKKTCSNCRHYGNHTKKNCPVEYPNYLHNDDDYICEDLKKYFNSLVSN